MAPPVDLDQRLNASGLDDRLAACWEGFDLGMRLADASTWDDGVDAAAALAAAAACAAGRDLLPLPPAGIPTDDLRAGAASDDATARALDRVASVLDSAARESRDAQEVVAWHAAAHHASEAAGCLRALRRQ